MIRWPWVSRRWCDYLELEIDRLRTERNEQQLRADRAIDIMSVSYTGRPVSSENVNRDDAARQNAEALMALEEDDLSSLYAIPDVQHPD